MTLPSAYTDKAAAFAKREITVVDLETNACRLSHGVGSCSANRDHGGVPPAGAAQFDDEPSFGYSIFVVDNTLGSEDDDFYVGWTLIIAPVSHAGTVAGGAAITVTLAAAASATDDYYNGMTIVLSDGQERFITDYDGTTKVATVDRAWTTTPTTETYKVVDTAAGQERLITLYVVGGFAKVAAVEPMFNPSLEGEDPANYYYWIVDRREACYLSWNTCRQRASYERGVRTIRLCDEGSPLALMRGPAPQVRAEGTAAPDEMAAFPLIDADALGYSAPLLDPQKGLSERESVTVKCHDTPAGDRLLDPYLDQRGAASQGTFWRRLIARDPHMARRVAKVRRGLTLTDAIDWTAFYSERYLIEAVDGPGVQGGLTLKLKDPLKVLDETKIPLVTAGKLTAELIDVAISGFCQGGASSTVTLPVDASEEDDFYNGMLVYITSGLGQGQERTITDYNGTTKVATVDSPWATVPGTGNSCDVGPASFTVEMESGSFADYDTYGAPPYYVAVGDELIKVASRTDGTFTIASLADRGALATERAEHDAGDKVQLDWNESGTDYGALIQSVLSLGGLDAALVDDAQIQAECDLWLAVGMSYDVHVCKPTKASDLVRELARQVNAVTRWDRIDEQFRFHVIAPRPPSETLPVFTDGQNIVDGTLRITEQESLRVTRGIMYFGQRGPLLDLKKPENFRALGVYIDADAENENAWGEVRAAEIPSRWFDPAAAVVVGESLARHVGYRVNGPRRVEFEIELKDYDDRVVEGGQCEIETDELSGEDGAFETTRLLILLARPMKGRIKLVCQTTPFNRRGAFIAADSAADYPGDSDYAHVTGSDGLMGNGDPGYRVI